MVCFFNEVTVNPDGSVGYTPTIPTPPDPGAPSGPDDDGSSDPGGGSSHDPTDCSGSLQGPRSTHATAHPASGDVPNWLIPQPDADPASGSDLLDPDYPDNPTPAEPPADCDDDETSEDEPEEEPSVEEQLETLLEEDPYALLDIPCDQIPNYVELAEHTAPQSVVDRLNSSDFELMTPEGLTQQAFIQTLDAATGPRVNMDFFGIRIHEDDLPGGVTPSEYYEQWRTNFNNFFDQDLVQFEFYPYLDGEDQRWLEDPLGTVFSIQLTAFIADWLDDGSVVATEITHNGWTFSTAWTPADFRHPVSGNRTFGFEREGEHVTFYTRGVDRVTARDYEAADLVSQLVMDDGIAFSSGDAVWENMIQNLKDDLGGSAEDVSEVPIRPDYDKLERVMDGDADPSVLGCSE